MDIKTIKIIGDGTSVGTSVGLDIVAELEQD